MFARIRLMMQSPRPELSILVPCFNNASSIPALLERLIKACQKHAHSWEIFFVDDGSTDQTWQEIVRAQNDNPAVRGIRLARNHGHQLAISAGMSRAQGDRILMIDADLEDPPELLGEMMKLMDGGIDNVYTVRSNRPGVALWKRICYRCFYRMLSFLAGCPIPENSGDFRLVSKAVLDHLNAMPESHRFLRGMISWLGFPSAPVYYKREMRLSGKSGYTLKKLLIFAMDGITSFSIMPLRLATLMGGVMSVIWFLLGIYVIASVLLFGAQVPGWASLIVVILMIGSVQLFVMGVMGEYLGRMFLQNKKRPLFVIKEEIGFSQKTIQTP